MLGDVNMVTEELKSLYYRRLLPIEKYYSFHHFHSPSYEDADFDNKPMVLVMGQYSTGKTTFIRYLLNRTYCLGHALKSAFCLSSNHDVGACHGLCVRYLIEQDFPGSRVGPEPTTDCFTALMYGEMEENTPGNALTVDPKKPFRNLNTFGNSFLNR